MIESPVLEAFVNKAVNKAVTEAVTLTERTTAIKNEQEGILLVLGARLGDIPQAVLAEVQAVQALEHLRELHRLAATCPDYAAFRARLAAQR